MCMLCVYRGQKRVGDLLALELQIVVSYTVGAGNWIWFSVRAAALLTVEPPPQPPNLNSMFEDIKGGKKQAGIILNTENTEK